MQKTDPRQGPPPPTAGFGFIQVNPLQMFYVGWIVSEQEKKKLLENIHISVLCESRGKTFDPEKLR